MPKFSWQIIVISYIWLQLFLDEPSEMFITWSTLSETKGSVVEYGKSSISEFRASGNYTKFTDGGPKKLTQFIHRVILRDLEPGQEYSKLTL